MGELLNCEIDLNKFSKKEASMLKILKKNNNLQEVIERSLQKTFSDFFKKSKGDVEIKTTSPSLSKEDLNTILSKLEIIDNKLTGNVVIQTDVSTKQTENTEEIKSIEVAIETPKEVVKPKKTNAKLERLKKLRGGT